MADTTLLDDLDPSTPIGSCLTAWHRLFVGEPDALEQVLADDVVLHSPVLFKPVEGKDLVTLYLTGAAMTFVNDEFRYVRMLTGERDAVLEFETQMVGKYVNGVDLITCDDAGLIVDFKVMVRPQRALEAVRETMFAALEELRD